MSKPWQRALTASLMMILASLAGCLDAEDVGGEPTDTYGTVMVSTYHIAELVSAVGGDLVNVEMISTTNVPVHDYEPSAQDIIRLQGADVFLYHGLGLEPWVDALLETMGADAPTASATHAMPSGEETLDFESILVGDLCRYLNSPSTTDVHLLAEDAEEADELHAEDGAYNLAMPEHDEEEHDEEEHDEEEHDEHGHGDEGLIEPEETLSTADSECPAGTTVSIYHLEEGEYVLEFETEVLESFTMAMAAMGGGHAHDDHGDDDHDDDDHGDDDHGDDDHGDLTPEEALSAFDSNGDSNLSWDEFWVAWNTDDDHDDHDDHQDGDDDHGDEDDHSPLEEMLEEYMAETLMAMFNESDADRSGGLSVEELEHFIEDIEAMEDDDIMPSGGDIVYAFDEDGDGVLSFEEFSEMMGMEHDHEEHDGNETHDDNETSEDEVMESMMQMMFDMGDMNSDGFLNASEVDMMLEMMGDEDDHHEEGVAFIGLHVEREGEYGIALPEGVSLHVLNEEGHEGHDDHGHDDDDEEGHDEEEDHDEHSDDEDLNFDPHSWLNPMAFSAQIDVVLGVLSAAFPDGADAFEANANAYKAELLALDGEFKAAFGNNGTCSANTVAANHNAYAYLASAYDLEFVTVHGLDPEGEPSAEDIAGVVERVNEDGITVLFVEEYTDRSAVASLVQQTVSNDLPEGLTVLTLYTMELAPMDSEEDYMSLMTKNLENLKTGLGC